MEEVLASGGTPSETLLALEDVGTKGAHPNLCRRGILTRFTDKKTYVPNINDQSAVCPCETEG